MNSHIPVFFTIDDAFAPCAAVAMASTCANTKAFLDFYIVDAGVTAICREQIGQLQAQFDNMSIEFIPINSSNFSADFHTHGNWPLAAYARFLIPELKPELDKVIYSDVDVIFTGDIAELFETELHEYALAAVTEGGEYPEHLKTLMVGASCKNMRLSDGHKYFNAGCFVLSCKKWREENITKGLCAVEKEYRHYLKCTDQDILNKYFDSNFLPLDPRFNLLNQDCHYYATYAPDLYAQLDKNLVIRHFNGAIKPWHYNICCNANFETFTPEPIAHFDDFWNYAGMTPFYDSMRTAYTATSAKYRGMVAAFAITRKKELALSCAQNAHQTQTGFHND